MRVERKIVHEGRVWYSVPAAERLPHCRIEAVREIMGSGEVEWTQLKVDGRSLVAVESLLDCERRIREKNGTG